MRYFTATLAILAIVAGLSLLSFIHATLRQNNLLQSKAVYSIVATVLAASLLVLVDFLLRRHREIRGNGVYRLELVEPKTYNSREFRRRRGDQSYLDQLRDQGSLQTVYVLCQPSPYEFALAENTKPTFLRTGYMLDARLKSDPDKSRFLVSPHWPIVPGITRVAMHNFYYAPQDNPIASFARMFHDLYEGSHWMQIASAEPITPEVRSKYPDCRFLMDIS